MVDKTVVKLIRHSRCYVTMW